MLARLTVVTPYVMLVPEGEIFEPYSYEDQGYQVIARPPGRSDVPVWAHVPEEIEIDGKPGFVANALQLDFQKETFDRRRVGGTQEPSVDVLARAVKSLTTRLRFVTRGAQIPPSRFPQTIWRLVYLNDDGSELPESPDHFRALRGVAKGMSYVAVSAEIWSNAFELDPDWSAPIWDDLLLDAVVALPNIGTAIVLASTALEVFIADVLDKLSANGNVPSDIWQWINNRREHDHEPSTEEQFDVLLKHFVGHSLKEKEHSELWNSFKNLRTARNKFVHEGAASVGGALLSEADAQRLIGKAQEIVNRVREWLPTELQWPVFPLTTEVRFTLNLIS